MFNPNTSPQSKFFMRSVEAAASSLGVRAMVVPVRSSDDIEPAFESFTQQSNGGLILPTDTFTRLRMELIAELASRYRLPAICAFPEFAREGGLTARELAAQDFRSAKALFVPSLKRDIVPSIACT